MAKKKRTKKKDVDVNIQIKNLDKLAKRHGKVKTCSWTATNCGGGFWGFGSALAMILSYTRAESILWAILHGVLSWFYILYRAMQIWGWF